MNELVSSVGFTDFMNKNCEISEYFQFSKKIKCKSGLEMSVQASEGHYCTPRKNAPKHIGYNYYTHFEIGFPNIVVEKLIPYAECDKDLTETVYPYTPKELIQEIISDNGGLE